MSDQGSNGETSRPQEPLPPPIQVTTTSATTVPQPGVSAGRATASAIGNIVWLVLAGWWLMILYLLAGLIACLTVIGIPFGIQSFKLAGYALWPFGRVVVRDSRRDAGLSTLGNVIWFVVGGWYLALSHLVAALLLAITVVGFPLALASLKMAGLALAPFGKKIVPLSSLGETTSMTVVSSIG
jgi:uncharacterized membrane protein YccF (DUF307 family)